MNEQRMVERHGFAVDAVYSGEEAVERACTGEPFDLILMDIDLGTGIDGTQAAAQILECRRVPIVFLTGHTEEAYVERVKRITSYGYVVKNSGEFVLIESINMALQLFHAHEEVSAKEREVSHIINEAPIGIYQTWSDGTFRHVNAEFARILGFSTPEQVFEHYTSIPKEIYVDPTRRKELLEMLKRDGTVRNFRFQAYRVDGSQIHLCTNARVLDRREDDRFLIGGFVVDETSRKRAEEEQERRHQEELAEKRRFRDLFEHATVGIIVANERHRILDVNPYALEILGYPREELSSLSAHDIIHPDDIAAHSPDEYLKEIQSSNTPKQVERRYRRKDGEYIHVLLSVRSLSGILPDASHVLMFHDITERRRAEEQLRYSEGRFRKLVENSPDLLLEIGPDNLFTYASPSVERITGYRADEFVGHHVFEMVHPDIKEPAQESLNASIADGSVRDLEIPIVHADGTWHAHWVRGVPFFDDAGNYTGAMAIVRDITERKAEKETTERLLQEKNLLLREVHHRIKNDMGMVSSLLSLQAGSAQSEEAIRALENARQRISVMKNAYERIYRDRSIGEVNLQSFLSAVVDEIASAYGAHRSVRLQSHIEETIVSSRVALPIGIIVSELLTNAYKYAFTDDSDARVAIAAQRRDDGGLAITVSDNGVGTNHERAGNESAVSGLNLVNELATQFRGHLALSAEDGTTAEVVLYPSQ